MEIKARSFDTPQVARFREQLIEQIFGAQKPDRVLDEVELEAFQNYINARALAEFCILDWRGVEEAGEPVAYSPAYLLHGKKGQGFFLKNQSQDARFRTPDGKIFNRDCLVLYRQLFAICSMSAERDREEIEEEKKLPAEPSDDGSEPEMTLTEGQVLMEDQESPTNWAG
jgi:hypothetical protein